MRSDGAGFGLYVTAILQLNSLYLLRICLIFTENDEEEQKLYKKKMKLT